MQPCAIPPPIGRPASSYRSSISKEHVQLPDLVQRALDQAKADEAFRAREEKSQGRSKAAEARAAELSRASLASLEALTFTPTHVDHPLPLVLPPVSARSESSEVAAGRNESSTAAAGAGGRAGKSTGASSSRSSAAAPRAPLKKSSVVGPSQAPAAASTSQRKASSAGRPRARSTAQPSHVQVSISDLGSDLSEPSDFDSPSAAPIGRARSDTPKRKRLAAATESEDEAVETTIIVESSASPPPQPPRKKARATDDASVAESDVDEPETWVPPKAKSKGRGYTKKAKPVSKVVSKPASKPSTRAAKTSSTARSSDAAAADDTWDELPGAREVAPPDKPRPKPKARLKKASLAAAAPKPSTSQVSTASKKSAAAKGKGKKAAPTRITPARRAAARANKHLADEAESEDIEDESQRMDVDDSPHSSTIEEFSTREKAEPARAKQRPTADRRTTTAAREPQLTAASGRAKAPVRVVPEPALSAADALSDEAQQARSTGSSRHLTPVSQADSYGGGMDYEPQLASPAGSGKGSVGSAEVEDGVLSLSLGEPVVSPAPCTRSPFASGRQLINSARALSRPRLAGAKAFDDTRRRRVRLPGTPEPARFSRALKVGGASTRRSLSAPRLGLTVAFSPRRRPRSRSTGTSLASRLPRRCLRDRAP